MMRSTMKDYSLNKTLKNTLSGVVVAVFWLIVWHIASVKINKSIILVSPIKVADTLLSQIGNVAFWRVVWYSFKRIAGGFFLALLAGTLLASVSAFIAPVRALLSPITAVVKATPVASFVILALFWFPSSELAIFISFLMCFPIIYTNVLTGIKSVDKSLLEMAQMFKIPPIKRLLFVYIPEVLPHFVSACSVSLGLCWKSGVAAEVIGTPTGSVGEMLYQAKIYLETAELFSWTIVIILVSMAFEKLFMLFLNLFKKRIYGAFSKSLVPQKLEQKAHTAGELAVRGITKSFGSELVLNNFSYNFEVGEPTCIMGKSGCGKTTLLRVIMGLEKSDSGEILLSGNRKFSVQFQEDRLCERLSAVANVRICADKSVTEENIHYVLESLGIEAESRIKPVSQLSGGMKRRVSLARALLAESGVLVLDEAFKGLDEQTYNQTITFAKEFSKGKTVICVTHDAVEAEYFGENLLVME